MVEKCLRPFLFVLLALGFLSAAGCRAAPTAVSPATPTATAVAAPTADLRELTILYTNDEHGWMAGVMPDQSAAHLMGLWRTEVGYQPDGPFLLLSGGDMWTGPAISTWFDGESMVEVMNAMGYAAAAVGNHEFDFGLETLGQRAEQADFPFLSANIRTRDDGRFPTDVGIVPYTIVTVNGIDVGLIGLTTRSTPTTTNPTNVAGFEFIDYEAALREVVPQVRAEGVDLLLVPAHVCRDELMQLATAVADLAIDLIGGGHCNELFATERDGTLLLAGGASLAAYATATFTVDVATGQRVRATADTRQNLGGTADPVIETIITRWQATTGDELNVVIGYSDFGLARRSQGMQDLITETWLRGYPAADVAITNLGGMRAPLPAGDITLADVVTVLPFNNVIVEVTVTGEQLLQILARAGDAAVGGVHLAGPRWILNDSGEQIDAAATYSLLVNDFMYAGGDDFDLLAQFDPDAYDTGIDWRQPVIDWILAQQSSPDAPLDAAMRALDD